MAYIECKVWHFQGDDNMNLESRHEAMKGSQRDQAGCRHFTVKALIDTTSSINFISKSLADKLGRKYGNHYKKVIKSLGTVDCLDISFRYKGKDRLVSSSDDVFNDFEVVANPYKADLILGIPWLWLRKAKIDIWKKGITIYDDFIPFCKYPKNNKYYYDFKSETDESKEQTGLEPDKEISSNSDFDYESCEAPTCSEKKIKHVKKKSGYNKVKPRRNQNKCGA